MATIGQSISLAGMYFEDFQMPFNLKAGIVRADVGKAVALDTAAANTVKLAGDGDVIVGRLETVEDRNVEGTLVGTVAFRFVAKIPYATLVAVGDTAVGSTTAGSVKPRRNAGDTANEADYSQNMVVEVDTTNSMAVVLKA